MAVILKTPIGTIYKLPVTHEKTVWDVLTELGIDESLRPRLGIFEDPDPKEYEKEDVKDKEIAQFEGKILYLLILH